MAMTPVKKLVASVGKKSDGKTVYQRVGTFLKRDDGTFALKLDCIPLGKEWDGWVNLYDLDPPKQDRQSMVAAVQGGGGLDDEIPFAPEVR